MNWIKILESAISGGMISFGVVIANYAITRFRETKEFRSNLALVVLELYCNYFLIPKPGDESKQVYFQTEVWDKLKPKLVLKIPEKIMLETEYMYYGYRKLSDECADEFFNMYLKAKTLKCAEELRKLAKSKAASLLELEEFNQRVTKNCNENEATPTK